MKGELWRQGSFFYMIGNGALLYKNAPRGCKAAVLNYVAGILSYKNLRKGAERRSEWNGDVLSAMADG